jgi:hypothetical protein
VRIPGGDHTFSSWQVFLLVYATSFCVTPFGFTALHRELGRLYGLTAFAQLAVLLAALAVTGRLVERAQTLTYPEAARRALGEVGGALATALLALFLFLWGPVGNLVTLVHMVHAFMLPMTTPAALVGLAALSAAYGAWFGPFVLAETLEAAALVFLPGTLVLAVIPYLTGVELGRVLPLGPSVTVSPSLADASLGLRGFALLLAGLPYVRPRHLPAARAGALGSWFLVALVALVPHFLMSEGAIARLPFPTLTVMDTVDASPLGLQSFLPLTFLVWYTLSWAVLAASLLAAAELAATALGLPSRRLVPALAILSAAATLLLLGMAQGRVDLVTHLFTAVGFVGAVLVPALVALRLRPREEPLCAPS